MVRSDTFRPRVSFWQKGYAPVQRASQPEMVHNRAAPGPGRPRRVGRAGSLAHSRFMLCTATRDSSDTLAVVPS
jgi:hypothetical protein